MNIVRPPALLATAAKTCLDALDTSASAALAATSHAGLPDGEPAVYAQAAARVFTRLDALPECFASVPASVAESSNADDIPSR